MRLNLRLWYQRCCILSAGTLLARKTDNVSAHDFCMNSDARVRTRSKVCEVKYFVHEVLRHRHASVFPSRKEGIAAFWPHILCPPVAPARSTRQMFSSNASLLYFRSPAAVTKRCLWKTRKMAVASSCFVLKSRRTKKNSHTPMVANQSEPTSRKTRR